MFLDKDSFNGVLRRVALLMIAVSGTSHTMHPPYPTPPTQQPQRQHQPSIPAPAQQQEPYIVVASTSSPLGSLLMTPTQAYHLFSQQALLMLLLNAQSTRSTTIDGQIIDQYQWITLLQQQLITTQQKTLLENQQKTTQAVDAQTQTEETAITTPPTTPIHISPFALREAKQAIRSSSPHIRKRAASPINRSALRGPDLACHVSPRPPSPIERSTDNHTSLMDEHLPTHFNHASPRDEDESPPYNPYDYLDSYDGKANA